MILRQLPNLNQLYQYFYGNLKLNYIDELLKDISRNPYVGIGKPEPLRFNYAGFWSRRIDEAHRLMYKDDDDEIQIAKCRFHYDLEVK